MRLFLTALFLIYYSMSSAEALDASSELSFKPCRLTVTTSSSILYAECFVWHQPTSHKKGNIGMLRYQHCLGFLALLVAFRNPI